MGLTPGQRITLINECATLLDKPEWDDIDLVLGQHGLPTSDIWNGEKRGYVIAMIKNASDESLQELHSYLTSESDHSSPGQSPFSGGRVRLFMSHLATHRELVGQVGSRLERYGVEAFVAHDSIEPSLEWQQVIEAALTDCDAMVVFLHDGFIDSRWCDQEVGWALGRSRPLLPLAFDANPHGFMGKFQALKCENMPWPQVGDAIVSWLVKTPTLHSAMAESLSMAFHDSMSWDFTRKVVPLLNQIPSFTVDQLQRLEQAAQDNVNVRDCNISSTSGPEWVAAFVKSRGGDDTESADSWEFEEPPF